MVADFPLLAVLRSKGWGSVVAVSLTVAVGLPLVAAEQVVSVAEVADRSWVRSPIGEAYPWPV